MMMMANLPKDAITLNCQIKAVSAKEPQAPTIQNLNIGLREATAVVDLSIERILEHITRIHGDQLTSDECGFGTDEPITGSLPAAHALVDILGYRLKKLADLIDHFTAKL